MSQITQMRRNGNGNGNGYPQISQITQMRRSGNGNGIGCPQISQITQIRKSGNGDDKNKGKSHPTIAGRLMTRAALLYNIFILF